jgi:glycosyltransferase involved in cell wall biosynthesis
MTIHDITTITASESHDFITKANERLLLKKTLFNVNCIISDSYRTKEDLIRVFHLPSEKIFVIHLAANPIFKPLNQIQFHRSLETISIPERFILYTGTLEKRKNLLTLMRAFYALKKEGIPHKLVLAGKCGNVKNEMKNLLRHLNLLKDVIFTGYIPVEDLLYLYNNADVFVYLSYYEGFGLPPLEAMACGCPVICSNSSSLPEVIGDAGILVNPHSVEEVKNSIKKFLNDPGFRKEMSQRSIERSLLFSWEKCARETYKVYKIAAGDS